MHFCDEISNQFPLQSIEGWALIRGVCAYLKRCLLDIPVSRVGAYSRGHLIKALWYLTIAIAF